MPEEIQDSALQISRANRGYRSPPQVDRFLQIQDLSLTYNGDGSINTISMTKYIAGQGEVTKVLTFGYEDGNIVSIDTEFLDT